MASIRAKLITQIEAIKSSPDYQGLEDLKKLLKQKERLEAVLARRKNTCMDMLKFLNEKLKSKQAFVTLLSDNNISPKIFMDSPESEDNEEPSEGQEDEQEENH
jgi:hypothetical protein